MQSAKMLSQTHLRIEPVGIRLCAASVRDFGSASQRTAATAVTAAALAATLGLADIQLALHERELDSLRYLGASVHGLTRPA